MMMMMSRKRTSSSSKIKTLNAKKKNTKDDTTHAEDKNAKRTTTKTMTTLGVAALAACAAMHCDASFADPSRLMNTIQCYPLMGGGFGGGYESVHHHHHVSEAISQTSMAGEDIPFWANMAKYARFSISIMVGFAYMFARPVAKLLKEPKTAALVVLAGYGGFEFIKFTITEMLAMNDPESLL